MELGRMLEIPQAIREAAEAFNRSLQKQRLQRQSEKLEKDLKVMDQQIRESCGGADHIQFDL